MEYQKIEYLEEDGVAAITLASPKNMNALDGKLIAELVDAFGRAAAGECRAVLLKSSARIFCSGGDLGTMYAGIKAGETDFSAEVQGASDIVKAMMTCPKPIVCAVNGAVAGAGICLALGADYVIADGNASFICAFVNVGLVPDTGGVFLLSRVLGDAKARELALTGRPVAAEEAKTLGMVAQVVAPDELQAAAAKMAARFAKGPALSYAHMKELLWQANWAGFDEYAAAEVAAMADCMSTQDFRDRVCAFIEKR